MPEGGWGVFETLHGYADVAEFARALKKLTAKHFGVLGPEFVAAVLPLSRHARDELLAWIEERRQAYIKKAREKIRSDSRDLTRVHGRFATIYASLRLAAELGIIDLRWKEVLEATLKCEADHVRFVGRKVAELNPQSPLQRLKEFLHEKCDEFIDLRRKVCVPANVHPPGYFARKDGDDYALLTDGALTSAVGGTAAASKLKHELQLSGSIVTTGGGGRKHTFLGEMADSAGRRNKSSPAHDCRSPFRVAVVPRHRRMGPDLNPGPFFVASVQEA